MALAVRDERRDLTRLVLLAISSQPPADSNDAIEIPAIECRRSGLSDLEQAWLTISGHNYDIAELSHYFEAARPAPGHFSKSFMKEVARAIRPLLQSSSARIDRIE